MLNSATQAVNPQYSVNAGAELSSMQVHDVSLVAPALTL